MPLFIYWKIWQYIYLNIVIMHIILFSVMHFIIYRCTCDKIWHCVYKYIWKCTINVHLYGNMYMKYMYPIIRMACVAIYFHIQYLYLTLSPLSIYILFYFFIFLSTNSLTYMLNMKIIFTDSVICNYPWQIDYWTGLRAYKCLIN